MKTIDEPRDYFIQEINQNELMSQTHKVCRISSYTPHLLILVTKCVSSSIFSSLIDIPIWMISSAVGLESFAITAGIKKYESIIKKNKKKYEKTVLLAKSKLNSTEVLVSKNLLI